MKDIPATPFRKAGRLLSRVWVWLPLTLGLLVVAALILLPFGMRYGLERWLIEQGAEQARVEDVDINLFLGRLALRNVQVRTAGERVLALPQVTLGFARLPLLQRRVVIDAIFLRDTALTIVPTPEGGWRIAGLERPAPEAAPREKSAWQFSVQRIEILRGELHYRGNGQSATARIERAEVLLDPPASADASWGATRIRLSGDLDWRRDERAASASSGLTADITVNPPADPGAPWRIGGNGELRRLEVRGNDGQRQIAAAERIALDDFNLSVAGNVSIRSLTIEDLALSRPASSESAAPLLRAAKLRVDSLKFLPDVLAINEVSIAGFRFVAKREKNKRWYGVAPVRDFVRSFDTTGSKKAGRAVRIKTVTLAEPGVVEFTDLTVKPVYQTRLTLTQAALTGWDTGKGSTTPAQVAASARIGKYSTVELAGEVRRLTPQMTAQFEVKLRELDLPALSGYTAQTLGYQMTSGQLNGQLDLKITADKLDGEGKLVFANFEVKSQAGKSAEEQRARLSMPLESGLSMLRDKNKNVNLTIDISGNIGDPKFDFTDALNQALARAVRTASVSYLKYYFQPFGTLITVAELAGKARQLRLDPVFYPAGAATPVPDMKDYLDKIGALLRERDNLRLKLCGKAVPIDGLSDTAAMELAERRAERLKDQLVGNYGIATDRLFQCAPELDRNAESQPRVELIL